MKLLTIVAMLFLFFERCCCEFPIKAENIIPNVDYEFEKFDSDEEISENDIRIKCADAIYVDKYNTVFLLDSYQKCIFKKTKFITTKIEITETVLPCDFYINNGKIFVFDEMYNEIHIYNFDGNIENKIKANFEDDYFRKFLIIDNKFYLLTYGDFLYTINLTENSINKEQKLPYNEIYEGFDFSEYIGKNRNEDIFYIQTNINEKSSIISGDIFITMKNIESENFISYRYPIERCTSLPNRYIHINEKGNVFVLLIEDEVVKIMELKYLLDEINSDVTREKYQSPETIESQYKKTGENYGQISYSRDKAFSRSEEMTNFKWILSDENVKFSSEDIKLPREIEYLASIQETDNWEIEIEGIPYCWGGYSSIYRSKKDSYNFEYTIENKDYVAGNIKTSGGYKGWTAGADCSGYVSVVYGLNEKYSTRTLVNISKPIKKLEDLNKMDMLVSPGSHVILFYKKFNDDCLLVNEVAAREGKSITQVRSLNWFIANGTYQMRTPFKN